MRILILSDIHLEFHRDGGESFIKSLNLEAADVVVLAGDIIIAQPQYMKCLNPIVQRSKHVVMVLGNHEYYGSKPENVHKFMAAYAEKHPNFHWLHNQVAVIEGQRFVGTPLWFRDSAVVAKHREWLNDFAVIKGFSHWWKQENADALAFLEANVKEGDVVITHHLPSYLSVHPMYAGTPQNCYFVCDVENIITEKKPRYWIHGHTHSSASYKLGVTDVVCNPFGYAGREVNRSFNDNLMIEV